MEQAIMRYELADGTPVARLEWTGTVRGGAWQLLPEPAGAALVAEVLAALPAAVDEMRGLTVREPHGAIVDPMVGYYGTTYAVRLLMQRYGADAGDEEIPDAWVGATGHRY
jgi:hypothetical protein